MEPEPIRARGVLSVWWAAAALPMLALLIQPRLVVIALPVCIGVVIGIVVWTDRRTRGSLLYCERLPVEIGQPFRGRIEAKIGAVPAEGFWLVLRCTEIIRSSDSEYVITVWQDECVVRPEQVSRRDASTIAIPFAFEMPASGKAVDDRVKWALEISAGRYAAKFTLPVVITKEPVRVTEDVLRPFATVRPSLRPKRPDTL